MKTFCKKIILSWYDIAELMVQNVLDKGLLLTGKLLNYWKLYGHLHDLVDRYGIFVSQMTTDMFHW
jgi:hypothetical protein